MPGLLAPQDTSLTVTRRQPFCTHSVHGLLPLRLHRICHGRRTRTTGAFRTKARKGQRGCLVWAAPLAIDHAGSILHACVTDSPWFPLELQPGSGRPLRGRLFGRRAPSQVSGHPGLICLRRFLLLSFGSYVPAPGRLAVLTMEVSTSSPSFVGACTPGIFLRRSFVAYFLRKFPGPCPGG